MVSLKQIHGFQVPEEVPEEELNPMPHQILLTFTFHKRETNKNRINQTFENDSLAVTGTRSQLVPHLYSDGGLNDGRHVSIEPPRLLAEPRRKLNPGRPALGRLIIAACRLLLAR